MTDDTTETEPAFPDAPDSPDALDSPDTPAAHPRAQPADVRQFLRRSVHRRERIPTAGGSKLHLLVLASTIEDTTVVDLATHTVMRVRVPWPEDHEPDITLFDVVEITLADDPERDDLAQPEAITVAGIPARIGALRGRRARRVVRHLVAPEEPHLLGFPGTSAPYWEFHGMRPSVALVVPSRGPLLFRRRADGTVWCRFSAARSDNWLPVEDRRAMASLWASRQDRLSGKGLATALGFRPHFLVVSVSRPRDGHCYKTVTAILPRP
jgi:hypothetical protein